MSRHSCAKRQQRNLSGAANLFIHFFVHFLVISFLCSLRNYLWNIAFCLALSRRYTLAPGPDLQGIFHQVLNCEAQVISKENSSWDVPTRSIPLQSEHTFGSKQDLKAEEDLERLREERWHFRFGNHFPRVRSTGPAWPLMHRWGDWHLMCSWEPLCWALCPAVSSNLH